MIANQRRIGIFDSGVGGLTVLKALYQQLPHEPILYFGDTDRVPYGTRTPSEIVQFSQEILTWMARQNVKMVLMACNTSSALALETVRSQFDFPILGLILPGAKAAVRQGKRIGTIATPATAQSGAYRQAMLEIDSSVRVWEIGCPEFVPLIEQNRLHDAYTAKVARSYLQPLIDRQIDTLVYGCTHYPHLEPLLRQILPSTVKLVDPAVHLVAAAAKELELLGLQSDSPSETLRDRSEQSTRFGVSGCPEQFARRSAQWLGFTPSVEKICLPHLQPQPMGMPLVE
jgi:glutamate racemase